jgi:hypothetical protein
MSSHYSLFKKDKRNLSLKYPNLPPVLVFILIICLVFLLGFGLVEQSVYTIGGV